MATILYIALVPPPYRHGDHTVHCSGATLPPYLSQHRGSAGGHTGNIMGWPEKVNNEGHRVCVFVCEVSHKAPQYLCGSVCVCMIMHVCAEVCVCVCLCYMCVCVCVLVYVWFP